MQCKYQLIIIIIINLLKNITINNFRNIRTILLFINSCKLFFNLLNSCPTQGLVRGWNVMNSLHWRSVNSKDVGPLCLSHHPRSRQNEWNKHGEMVEWNLWQGQNGRNHEKNLPRLWFIHHVTHMEWSGRKLRTPAVEGKLTNSCN